MEIINIVRFIITLMVMFVFGTIGHVFLTTKKNYRLSGITKGLLAIGEVFCFIMIIGVCALLLLPYPIKAMF